MDNSKAQYQILDLMKKANQMCKSYGRDFDLAQPWHKVFMDLSKIMKTLRETK